MWKNELETKQMSEKKNQTRYKSEIHAHAHTPECYPQPVRLSVTSAAAVKQYLTI